MGLAEGVVGRQLDQHPQLSRPHTQTVAGCDLTFSPVKSVFSFWAVADPHIAARIEQTHQAAVQDATIPAVQQAFSLTRSG
jgi:hypothetical protein